MLWAVFCMFVLFCIVPCKQNLFLMLFQVDKYVTVLLSGWSFLFFISFKRLPLQLKSSKFPTFHFINFPHWGMNNKHPLFGSKVRMDVCPRTLSVPRCEEFSSRNRICPLTKIQAYVVFAPKGGSCIYHPSTRRKKMCTDRLSFTAWDVHFSVFSGTNSFF